MSINYNLQNLSSHQLEAYWLELLKLTTACAEESLVDHKLLQYELSELRRKIDAVLANQDQTDLQDCLSQCQQLLAYYVALRKQAQQVDETGSTFSRQALERLKEIRKT